MLWPYGVVPYAAMKSRTVANRANVPHVTIKEILRSRRKKRIHENSFKR